MADITWADSPEEESAHEPVAQGGGLNMKFLIGGLLILAAVVILVVAGTLTSGRFFITVEELVNRPELVGETVQTSGVVLGDTIKFQEDPMELHFTIAHISDDTAQIEDEGGLAQALHVAASDTSRARVPVVVEGMPMPDLLQHEAQAILTGYMGADGVFHATDLMLKCPTRYDEAVPEQAG